MLMVIVFVLVSVATVYAVLFSSTVPVDSDVTLHVIGSDVTNISISKDRESLVFTSPGDKINITLRLENNSENIFRYYYKLGIVEEYSSGLQDAILVYFDGVFADTLGALCASGKAAFDGSNFILGKPESGAAPAKTHTLTFELHSAAAGTYYSGREVAVSIESYALTPNFQTDIFVGDETEFVNAVNDVNFGSVPYNIRLTRDITLTKNYTLKNPCSIDLMGNELVFGGNYINLEQSGTVKLFSSDKTHYTELTSESGGITLNGAGTLLNIVEFGSGGASPVDAASLYAGRVTINSDGGVKLFDAEGAKNLVCSRFSDKIKNGLTSGQSVSLFGALAFYRIQGGLSVGVSSGDYVYDGTSGVITAPEGKTRTYPTSVTVAGEKIDFKINGADSEGTLASILQNELAHIPASYTDTETGETVLPEVTYDLFLPALIQGKNASVVWWSSDASLMSSSGKIGDTAQGQVSLVATIRINDSVYSRVFTFSVYRQDNEMKFQYLLALMNPVTLGEVYDAEGSVRALAVVDGENANDYRKILTNGADLGITALEYEVEPVYYFLTVTDEDGDGYQNDLYLNQPTFQSYAQIKVRGRFGDEVYEGTVGVEISLGNNAELQNKVYTYIESKLNETDVLANLIRTRVEHGMANEKGDFVLPAEYMGYKVEYSVPIVKNSLQRIVDIVNPSDTDYKALIEWAEGTVSGKRADAVVKGLDPSVASLLSDGNQTVSADEEKVILSYISVKNYAGYQTEWKKYITASQRSLRFDLANGIISSITPDGDEVLIGVNPLGFFSSETQIPIGVTVYMEGVEIGKETRLLTFAAPAALHADSEGFKSRDIFESVKFQVWQQLPVDERGTPPFDETEQTITFGDGDLWSYLLVRDMQFCKTLAFVNGSEEDRFDALLGWAESNGNAGQRADEVVPGIDASVAASVSNGKNFITAEEEAAIKKYLENYAGYEDVWQSALTDAYDYEGRTPDFDLAVQSQILANITLTYISGGNSDTITEFLNWATYDGGFFGSLLGRTKMSYHKLTLVPDPNKTSSNNSAIDSTEANDIITSYAYFGYNEFGAAWNAAMTQLGYGYNFTPNKDTFAAAILAQMKTAISAKYANLIAWATGGGSEAPSSEEYGYLADTGSTRSDSLPTISLDEAEVLKEFWRRVAGGNTLFDSIVNNPNYISKVKTFTATGKSEVSDFFKRNQPVGSEPLLSIDGQISVGMDAVLAQGYREKVDSYYMYTGVTTPSYTNGNIYKLAYNGGYIFENTNALITSSDEEMSGILENATGGTEGMYALFAGVSELYETNALYRIKHDQSTDEYYFEKVCKPSQISLASGTAPLYFTHVSSLDTLSNISGPTTETKATAMAEFKNLACLTIFGSTDTNTKIFSTTTHADSFFNNLTSGNSNLETLELNYAYLSDISTIYRLSGLVSVDLSGNPGLSQISPLLALDLKNVGYIDVSNTGINIGYQLGTLQSAYYQYYSSNGAAPQIYYSSSGARTLLEPSLTQNQQTALRCLYYLGEMGQIKTKYMPVPVDVYTVQSTSYPVIWQVISDNIRIFTKTSGGRTYTYIENLATDAKEAAVVSATITVNGESFTRYFEISLIKVS